MVVRDTHVLLLGTIDFPPETLAVDSCGLANGRLSCAGRSYGGICHSLAESEMAGEDARLVIPV